MNTDTQKEQTQYTYECYMLSCHWQKLPERKFSTLEAAQKARAADLSYGHKCYEIQVTPNGR